MYYTTHTHAQCRPVSSACACDGDGNGGVAAGGNFTHYTIYRPQVTFAPRPPTPPHHTSKRTPHSPQSGCSFLPAQGKRTTLTRTRIKFAAFAWLRFRTAIRPWHTPAQRTCLFKVGAWRSHLEASARAFHVHFAQARPSRTHVSSFAAAAAGGARTLSNFTDLMGGPHPAI